MHPTFKELYTDTDAEDQAAEQERRLVRRSRRARPTMIARPPTPSRQNQPRP